MPLQKEKEKLLYIHNKENLKLEQSQIISQFTIKRIVGPSSNIMHFHIKWKGEENLKRGQKFVQTPKPKRT